MTIAEISLEDAADILALEKERIGDSLGPDEVAQSVLEQDYISLVAKEDGKLVGYVLASVSVPEGEIYSIAVKQDQEGHGIGHQLLEAALAKLRERGVSRVLLEVEDGNERAYNLYLRVGFQEYRRRPNYYGSKDAIFMEKRI